MSDSDSSANVDEGSLSCPEYDVEDEYSETTSKNENKHEPSYVAEEDFIQDDIMPYTDEPLADESWVEEYERRREEHDREVNELSLRLNGQSPVNSW